MSYLALNTIWCSTHEVQMRVLCEECRRLWRAGHGDGVGWSDYQRVFGKLATWRPPIGLSPRMYLYVCPAGHRTFAEMTTPNGGHHYARKEGKPGKGETLCVEIAVETEVIRRRT